MTQPAQQQQQSAPVRSASQKPSASQAMPATDDALTAMHSPSHEDIAVRAYGIYSQKGRAKGQCRQNWHQAEQELRKQQAASGAAEYRNTPLVQRDGTEPIGKNYDQVMPSGKTGNMTNSGGATHSPATGTKNKY